MKQLCLEFQITKSDLRSHFMGLYPKIKYLESYSHLNWFRLN
jgi:hypothetical protein